MAKKLFVLPTTPIDKYKIEYYRVNGMGERIQVDIVEAVYYVNTPYEVLNHGVVGGAPIKDDWMMYVNGSCTGRFEQWDSMNGSRERFDNSFLTRKEAVDFAIALLQADITYHERCIREAQDSIKRLVKGN